MTIRSENASLERRRRPIDKISVRVPANGYFSAAFVGAFFGALAMYLEQWPAAYVILAISWAVIPLLAMTDRIVFNGKRLYRTGIIAMASAYLTNKRFWLKPIDIEQAETTAIPTFKRGGRVFIRYQTVVRGKEVEFSFSSGGRNYRKFVRELFSRISEEVLDAVSIELRDYAGEPRQVRARAKQSQIPASDVLESAFKISKVRTLHGKAAAEDISYASSAERAITLRQLGNELRVSGSFLQALESFRRAAIIRPDDAWLLFDFARCMQAFAGTQADVRLERRAAALMRLAERRAGNDGHLLAMLGESYSQFGEWERARNAFRKATDAVGEHFRSIRGMAEIALRDGKLAHVVHNFGAAGRLAESPAARRWSNAEADYFMRLSSDEEYLEMELGRVNLLDTLDRWRRISLKLAIACLPIIGLGVFYDDPTTANLGWGFSGSMLLIWGLFRMGRRVFAPRISPELLDG